MKWFLVFFLCLVLLIAALVWRSYVLEEATDTRDPSLSVATQADDAVRAVERQNIARRLELLNDQNQTFYVYLFNYGTVMAYYTAKGKVSSETIYGSNGDGIFFFTPEGAYVEWRGDYMVSDFPLQWGSWFCKKYGAAFNYRNAHCHADQDELLPQEEEAQERFGETMREIRGEPT